MAQIRLGLDDRGQRRGACSFGQCLLLFEQHQDGARNLLVVHGDNLIHITRDEWQGQIPGPAHCNAVSDGRFSGRS